MPFMPAVDRRCHVTYGVKASNKSLQYPQALREARELAHQAGIAPEKVILTGTKWAIVSCDRVGEQFEFVGP